LVLFITRYEKPITVEESSHVEDTNIPNIDVGNTDIGYAEAENEIHEYKESDQGLSIKAKMAIREIDDKVTLLEIVKNDKDKFMRLHSAWKLNDQALYADIATNTNEEYKVRHYVIQSLADQTLIAKIATSDDDWRIRDSAVLKLNDKTLLADIAENDEHHIVRWEAEQVLDKMRGEEVRQINDQALLAEIVKNDASKYGRYWAALKLEDEALLAEVIENDESSFVQRAAERRLNELKGIESPDPILL